MQHLSGAISKASVIISKVFAIWICFLAVTLKHVLLIWSSKESVRKNLPKSFRNHPNTRVEIDCTEIFIQRTYLYLLLPNVLHGVSIKVITG